MNLLKGICPWQNKMKMSLLILSCVAVTLYFIFIYTFMNDNKVSTYPENHEDESGDELEIEQDSASLKTSTEGIWTINSIGRLGNQMGEYATLYALAKLNGHQAYILPSMANYLSPLYKITLPTLHESLIEKLPWKPYGLHDWMDDRYRNIAGDYQMLLGYTCSWTFYHHLREEILREFTFHDFIMEETNAYLRRIGGVRKNVTFVGVHVRRGDYIHIMTKVWKGVVADKKYLEKAMTYFRHKYKNVIFVVTSNGMDWCKRNINNSKGDVFFSDTSNSPGQDLSILAHCNHTIMTIGTFGYWAGYLAGGETIFLNNFTLPDSPFLKVFKYEAAFLPQWIGFPADLSAVEIQNNRIWPITVAIVLLIPCLCCLVYFIIIKIPPERVLFFQKGKRLIRSYFFSRSIITDKLPPSTQNRF